jgi:Flp pilus assembly protein CpaB
LSPVSPRRKTGLTAINGPTLALVAAAAVVVILGVLMALGVVDLSKLRSNKPNTAGLIAVPTPARLIPAYTRVRRDHLWDTVNTRFTVVYLPPRAVTPEMMTNIADIIGRVLDHDKEAGYVFTQDDFLPKGTREGLVAGIPAGMRAVRVSADKIDGLYGLHAGDRFDLMATLPIDATSGGGQTFNAAGPYASQLALQAQLSNWQKQATVRVIVQNAIIVEPMSARGVTTVQSSLTEGPQARVRAVQEAVIAIAPDEVAPLTEAMAVDARLTSVPRSGRPDDPVNSRTPNLRPFSPFANPNATPGVGTYDGEDTQVAPTADGNFKVVETIMGQKRALTAVPRR